MQDALPAFVLDSQEIGRSAMNGTPGNFDSQEHPVPEPVVPEAATPGSDEQLMAAFAGGSKDAFGELFSRYKQPLYGFFRRRVADAGQAEELTRETFSRCFALRQSEHLCSGELLDLEAVGDRECAGSAIAGVGHVFAQLGAFAAGGSNTDIAIHEKAADGNH